MKITIGALRAIGKRRGGQARFAIDTLADEVERLAEERKRLASENHALRLRVGQTAALLTDGYHNDSTGVGYCLQSVMLAHRVAERGRVEPGAFHYDAEDFSSMEGVYRADADRVTTKDSPHGW